MTLPAPVRPWGLIGPYYVATTGSDTTGDGSQGNPWASIDKARSYIQAHKLNRIQSADIIVYVGPGRYFVTSTINFTFYDSGFNGFKVRYVATGGPGSVELCGGSVVTGWSLYSGNVYRAQIGTTPIYTLYENGKRSICARIPKRGATNASYPLAFSAYFMTQSDTALTNRLKYLGSDFDPSGYDLSTLQVVIWSGGNRQWITDTLRASAVDTGAQRITTQDDGKFTLYLTVPGSRYYLQNQLSFLTNPGEWYHDRSTGYLYYYARDGAIGGQEVIVPRVQEVVRLQGYDSTYRCANIEFDGISIGFTDFNPWWRSGSSFTTDNVYPPQSAATSTAPANSYFTTVDELRIGALHLRDCDHVTYKNGKVRCAGVFGIYADGYNTYHTLREFQVERTGVSGVRFDGRYPGQGDVCNHHLITDFKVIYHGELSGGASGIDLGNSSFNEISYGYIAYGPRKALWIFGCDALDPAIVYSHDNYTHHILAEYECGDSGDTGAFGISSISSRSGGPYNVNTFSQIIIQHIHADPTMTDIQPNGFFTDDESWNQVLSNIQCIDIQYTLFRINNSGGHTYTNCNFLPDGTSNPAFNPALMDTANIGPLSSFPF